MMFQFKKVIDLKLYKENFSEESKDLRIGTRQSS